MSTKNEIYEIVENAARDLSIKEVAQKAGVTRQTASKHLTVLEAEGRIKISRRVGNAVFFDVPQPA